MDKDYLTEKLNSIRNEMSHIWGGIFVLGGGVATLLSVAHWTTTNIILCLIGILLTVIFTNAYMIRKDELMNMLSEFNEENNNERE